jgi:hypothetical protein
MVHDLMQLMPPPAPAAASRLSKAWFSHFDALDDLNAAGAHEDTAQQAEAVLTEAIRSARRAVLTVLAELE